MKFKELRSELYENLMFVHLDTDLLGAVVQEINSDGGRDVAEKMREYNKNLEKYQSELLADIDILDVKNARKSMMKYMVSKAMLDLIDLTLDDM